MVPNNVVCLRPNNKQKNEENRKGSSQTASKIQKQKHKSTYTRLGILARLGLHFRKHNPNFKANKQQKPIRELSVSQEEIDLT